MKFKLVSIITASAVLICFGVAQAIGWRPRTDHAAPDNTTMVACALLLTAIIVRHTTRRR